MEAEKAELRMLEERETWELVPRPTDKHVIGSRFTYAIKTTGDGTWYKDKVRFIVQGFSMIRGIDFNETWAAVARFESIRMTAAFIAAYGLIPWQIDFTSAYLNSKIEEEVYMQQPQGHEVVGKEDWVCHLLKTLYGTKQGASNWWKELNQVSGITRPKLTRALGRNGKMKRTSQLRTPILPMTFSEPHQLHNWLKN